MAGAIALITLIAFLTETIIDVLKVHLNLGALGGEKVKATLWPCVAAAVGIGLAFAFQASVLPLIAEFSSVSVAWPVDRILAGVIAGAGGASLLYDLLDTASREGVK